MVQALTRLLPGQLDRPFGRGPCVIAESAAGQRLRPSSIALRHELLQQHRRDDLAQQRSIAIADRSTINRRATDQRAIFAEVHLWRTVRSGLQSFRQFGGRALGGGKSG